MKPPRAKLHLVDSEEPLYLFQGLQARCELLIRNGEAKWMAADELKPGGKETALYPRGTCPACLFLEPVGDKKKRYVYAVREAETAELEAA